jgi:hypothetical protein
MTYRQQVSQLAIAIDNIEKEFELLDKFIADLVRFKKDVAAAVVKVWLLFCIWKSSNCFFQLGLKDEQIQQMDWNVEKIASSRYFFGGYFAQCIVSLFNVFSLDHTCEIYPFVWNFFIYFYEIQAMSL